MNLWYNFPWELRTWREWTYSKWELTWSRGWCVLGITVTQDKDTPSGYA